MKCSICNSDAQNYNKVRDTFSDEYFNVAKCNSCNFEWLSTRPTPQEIGKYYDNLMGDIMRTKRSSLFAKLQTFLFKLDINPLLKRLNKDDLIIDWGAGHGLISQIIKDLGNNIVAADIFPKENWKINDIKYLEIDSNDFESLANNSELIKLKPKAVILRHTLEHFHEPVKLVEFFHKIGIEYVLIVVPNQSSFLKKIFKNNWPYWDPPRHLSYFSPNNLQLLMNNNGYIPEFTKTYGLDEIIGSIIRYVKINKPKNRLLNSIFHYNTILLAISSSIFYLFTNAVIWGLYKRKSN